MTATTHRRLIIGGAALVAAVAMAASADTLAGLGRAVGWDDRLAWSLPVSVDVLALVAGLAWLAAGAGRSLGRALTLIAVAGSVVLNAVGHLVAVGHMQPGPHLVIAVSAVPPLAAALAVHLGAAVTTDQPADMAAPLADTAAPEIPAPAAHAPVEAVTDDQDAMPPAHPDTLDTIPEPGRSLTDTELDAVVHVLTTETDPPRSYRDMEARFRTLGYSAGASRLREAWRRVTADTDVEAHA
ncbi:DUF2637 domain-containing protein [Streptomyces sp. NPDC059063]|uniref:DUF2637 domain-containing protein n=1 Tax=unclassified Streptomyces TaxID=2593676 RepID=UPI0036C2BC79